MPKSTTRTCSGSSRCASLCATSTPNASSPRKMFPTPATRTLPSIRDLAIQRQRLHFCGGEEEAVSGLPHHAELAPGIVFENDRQVHLIIKVTLYGFHDRDFPLQRQVHNVRALLWPQSYAVAHTHRHSENGHALQR